MQGYRHFTGGAIMKDMIAPVAAYSASQKGLAARMAFRMSSTSHTVHSPDSVIFFFALIRGIWRPPNSRACETVERGVLD
jgi:hypothetical protein